MPRPVYNRQAQKTIARTSTAKRSLEQARKVVFAIMGVITIITFHRSWVIERQTLKYEQRSNETIAITIAKNIDQ